MARAGSKPIYTEAIAKEILDGIGVGLTDKDAILAAGISEDTFARWMKGQRGAPADLADRVSRARPRRTKRWLSRLFQQAEAGDVKAIAELLDRCAPDYRKTHRVEQTVTVEVRRAAEKVAAELGVPVDVVLAETYRLAEDES